MQFGSLVISDVAQLTVTRRFQVARSLRAPSNMVTLG